MIYMKKGGLCADIFLSFINLNNFVVKINILRLKINHWAKVEILKLDCWPSECFMGMNESEIVHKTIASLIKHFEKFEMLKNNADHHPLCLNYAN